ncbi:MAG: polyprenyl diphosphate synthase, partial [Candidatus Omnitrophica bacterium]|nr:polyprenyl diphosphate synthase [Candidatus Omnitrophota bacterium]
MIDKNNIPRHIAIIMDGNGRWAKERGLPRTAGHREGAERVREIVNAALELGVKVVTFFAFSTENWNRPKSEINMLMRFLEDFLDREVKKMNKNNIRFQVIGRDEPLPKVIQKKIKEASRVTKGNNALVMVLALNYGSRQEIVDAVKKFAGSVSRGETDIEDIDVDTFSSYLY